MKRVSLFLTDVQIQGIRSLKKKFDRPAAWLIRFAVDRFLEREGENPASRKRKKTAEVKVGNCHVRISPATSLGERRSVIHSWCGGAIRNSRSESGVLRDTGNLATAPSPF